MTPHWLLYADHVPGYDAGPCRCFYVLENALEEPEGLFRLDLRNPDWLGYGTVSLAGEVQLLYCPKCGGRCAAWRPEAIAAHARYREARKAYAFLAGKQDYDAVHAACTARGAALESESDLSRTWICAGDHIAIHVQWDSDHDGLYGHCTFAPGAELLARPFVAT
jgi:hypothetical protein